MALLVVAAALPLVACDSPQVDSKDAAPEPRGAYVVTTDWSQEGTSLKGVSVGAVVAVEVDVSGLDVDLDCARKLAYRKVEEVRWQLLRQGCAEITGPDEDEDERAAQEAAVRDGLGRWDPGLWARTTRWLKEHWQVVKDVFEVVVGILGLGFVTAFIGKMWAKRYEKRIHVVLLGSPGSGKTQLWRKWKDDSVPFTDSRPTVGVARTPDLEPVPYGKYTLIPRITDTAGSEPWEIRNQLNQSPRRAKRVLVFVLAPRADDAAGAGFDSRYVAEQKGYASVPRAVLGDRRLNRKLDLVIVFGTKFDLLSNSPPGDSSAKGIGGQFDSQFQEHRNLIEGVCKKNRIPFVWIVGSARTGWGVQQIRESIRKVVMS
ncbi:GTPase domain-containing protein [Micromonospora haikouensis]|uniref:GTPase domain-containing protein n=1 Tax=Micromonospora haikouensis TaxID=686309 RepID=UPI003D70B22B